MSEHDVPEFVARAVERMQPYCICCGAEIVAGDVCADCEAEATQLYAEFQAQRGPDWRTLLAEQERAEIDRICELARLRDGIGTPDERADYAATREMIQGEE